FTLPTSPPSPFPTRRSSDLSQMEMRLRKTPVRKAVQGANGTYSSRTWVTRKGVHVDRIASAWLIRRFVDPKAKFKFVSNKGYRQDRKSTRLNSSHVSISYAV